MKTIRRIAAAIAALSAVALISYGQRVVTTDAVDVKRSTLAISYPEGHDSTVNIIGTSLSPTIEGKAKVERKAGRTRIKLELDRLANPQSLGAFYTTYILWAIAPEGQADSLAELQIKD